MEGTEHKRLATGVKGIYKNWPFIQSMSNFISLLLHKTVFSEVSKVIRAGLPAIVKPSVHLHFRNSHHFHSVFHSFHGLINSRNWPALQLSW